MEFLFKPDNLIVTLSSLSYLVSGIFVFRTSPLISVGLILMTCIASLHHSFPDNIYIRLFDWLSALLLIGWFFYFAYSSHQIAAFSVIAIVILLFLLWLTSFIAFKNEYFLIYNISHASWHILSAIFIFLLATKFFT